MTLPTFEWEGDLDDDCTCRSVPGYTLRAELMSDGLDPDDPGDTEHWWCAAYRDADPPGDPDLFHSTSDDVLPLTGPAARRLAELAVLADLYRRGCR